jgi:hypothetical protein
LFSSKQNVPLALKDITPYETWNNVKPNVNNWKKIDPIVKMTSLNVLFSFVVSLDLEVHQMDLCTTFFNCTFQEEILMQQPQGYIQKV